MSYCSWLKDVWHVQDLGPHCREIVDYNSSHEVSRLVENDSRWRALRKRELPIADVHKPFFGSKMHDSYVVRADREDEIFTIKLSCRHGQSFIRELSGWLELELPQVIMPVNLMSHGVKFMRWARHNKRGVFTFARPSWKSFQGTDWSGSDTFVSDWFEEIDGRLQWISIHRSNIQGGSFDGDLFAMVDCQSVSAFDGRAAVIESTFGGEARELWNSYAVHQWDEFSYKLDVEALFNETTLRIGASQETMVRNLTALLRA